MSLTKGVNEFRGGVSIFGGSGGYVELGPSILLNARQVAAAGNSQGTATAIQGGLSIVTGADGTKGVVLPTPKVGELIIVLNASEASVLEIWPASGGEINTALPDASFSVAAMGLFIAVATSATQWYAAEPAVAVA